MTWGAVDLSTGTVEVRGIVIRVKGRARSPSETRSAVASARLKALSCELECVVDLAWRCVSNPFKLHAGMEFIGIAVFGQLLGNVLQRRCIRGINQCSKVGIGLLPRLCPEPKSGEQYRSVFNEVVGDIRNEVLSRVRRRIWDVRPNVLLRLFFELNECAHTSASHRTGPVVTTPWSSDPQ